MPSLPFIDCLDWVGLGEEGSFYVLFFKALAAFLCP